MYMRRNSKFNPRPSPPTILVSSLIIVMGSNLVIIMIPVQVLIITPFSIYLGPFSAHVLSARSCENLLDVILIPWPVMDSVAGCS